MPRQSRGRSAAPARPAAPPARPTVPAQQPSMGQRPASTAAHPPAQQHAPPMQQGSQGPGLFGQMASTAAGVAVGSSIGHAVGGWFSGGSSAPAEQQASQAVAEGNPQAAYSSSYNPPRVCEPQVTSFRQCMDQNQGDLTICGWYMEQLKSCQQAASQY